KREWLYCFKIRNFDHAYKLIFEYIETFYNTVRSHSHCGYLSPKEYEFYYYTQLKEAAEATLQAYFIVSYSIIA
ncbi:MAG: IS3 family transposase, partial [Desulfitobacteriaceae bacterium]|nr:IS3 family transposase [Desulfitobacteriaceae bacterium]